MDPSGTLISVTWRSKYYHLNSLIDQLGRNGVEVLLRMNVIFPGEEDDTMYRKTYYNARIPSQSNHTDNDSPTKLTIIENRV